MVKKLTLLAASAMFEHGQRAKPVKSRLVTGSFDAIH